MQKRNEQENRDYKQPVVDEFHGPKISSTGPLMQAPIRVMGVAIRAVGASDQIEQRDETPLVCGPAPYTDSIAIGFAVEHTE